MDQGSGPDSSDVLRAQRHLGNILRHLGRFEESTGSRRTRWPGPGSSAKTTRPRCRCAPRSPPTSGPAATSRKRCDGSGDQARTRPATGQTTRARCGPCPAWPLTTGSTATTARPGTVRAGLPGEPPDRPHRGGRAQRLDRHRGRCGSSASYQEAYDVSQEARDYGEDEGLGPEHLATLRAVPTTPSCRRIRNARGALGSARRLLSWRRPVRGTIPTRWRRDQPQQPPADHSKDNHEERWTWRSRQRRGIPAYTGGNTRTTSAASVTSL